MRHSYFWHLASTLCILLFIGLTPVSLRAQGTITFTTEKAAGESISMTIKATDTPTIEGATGTWANDRSISYKLSGSTVTITGRITEFSVSFGDITQMSFSNCADLDRLDLMMNKLSKMDLAGCPNLTYLNVMYNALTSLDLTPLSKLTAINCAANQLSELKLSGGCPSLVSLDCGQNQLTSLDLSNKGDMEALKCPFNKISSLDLSGLPKLKGLDCQINKLTTLNTSENPLLQLLVCYGNQLSALDLQNNREIVIIDCGQNPIEAIDFSPLVNVSIIDCSGAQLKTLNVAENRALGRLNCHNNQLVELDLSQNLMLRRLSCFGNKISGSAMTAMLNSIRDINGETGFNPGEGEIVVVNTVNTEQDNTCTENQVKIATAKGWKVMDFNGKHGNRKEYTGSPEPVSQNGISFTTATSVGETITLAITANGPVELSGLSGATWKNAEEITYTVDSENVFIHGDIIRFVASENKITAIDVSQAPSLIHLNCAFNQLSSLPLAANVALEELKCEFNNLSTLSLAANTNLKKLWCYNNTISTLDLSKNTLLTLLSCSDNNLKSLNLTAQEELQKLSCSNNPLGTLNLSENKKLEVLWCVENNLSNLDLSLQPELNQVVCQNNQLKELNTSHNPKLKLIWCSANQISALNATANTELIEIWCYDNLIAAPAMGNLVNSLPTRVAADEARLIVINTPNAQEGNVCTKEHVGIANGKQWKVYDLFGAIENLREYAGSTSVTHISGPKLSMYPNPASDLITIKQALARQEVVMIDATGKVVRQTQTNQAGEAVVPVIDLPEGIYLLSVGDTSSKVVIKR